MNERIKILLKQATITRYSGYAWSDEVDQQQFAELIVRECVNVIRADYVDLGTTAAVNNIENHFGVE